MRILIANDFLLNSGGGEIVVSKTKKLLKEKGHKVFIIGGTRKEEKNIILCIKRFFNFKYYLLTKKIINNNNNNIDIDILHIHDCNEFISPTPILAAKKMNKKVIMTIHSFCYFCPRIWGINNSGDICEKGYSFSCLFSNCQPANMNRIFFIPKWIRFGFFRYVIKNYVDQILCPSKILKIFIQKTLNISDDKITYLPNFVEISDDHKVNFSKMKCNQFLFVGRISKEKGIDVAIRAINILVKEYNLYDINFKIIGEGEDKNRLKILIKNLNIEKNIKFLGKINNDKLDKYYQESLAILTPSVCLEAFGLVNIEAMKNKTPIIASDIGGIPDIIEHNKNGYLFKTRNYKEMSKYIKMLYKNIELSKKLGENGFEKVKREFNKEKHYNNLMKVYLSK